MAASRPDTTLRVSSVIASGFSGLIARAPDARPGRAHDAGDGGGTHEGPDDVAGDVAGEVPGGWGDDLTRSSLQLLAESLTQLTGFTIAAIAIVGDDDRLHTLAVSGSLRAWERLRGVTHRVETLDRALAVAEDWGAFRFVPAERVAAAGLAQPTWTSAEQPPEAVADATAIAWQPLDMLIAPLRDETGRLRGTLSIDVPRDGRRPSPRTRRQLDRYAELAARSVITALERERLAKDVRLAEVARQVIRDAAQDLSLNGIVAHTGDTLIESFRLAALGTMLFDVPGAEEPIMFGAGVRVPPADADLAAIGHRAAQRLWQAQTVSVLGRDQVLNADPSPERRARALEYLAQHGLGSVMHVPLGAGDTLLGSLSLLRDASAPAWTDAELEVAGEIGRDLGRLLLTARAFQRQQELADQLRTLDSRKSRLIAVLSHELKNPLSAVVTNLEMLEDDLDPQDRELVVEALSRSATRMAAIADDLQAFSEAGSADDVGPAAEVDLGAIAREVVELARPAAERDGLSLTMADPAGPVVAPGDSRALFRALTNLVANAVKYTPAGGRVAVALHRRGSEVEVAVSDTGIGIPDGERDRLFEEFYRAEDPRTRSQPGSGLGLAIVDRIVRRHGGRVEVDSAQGLGSTFRLVLPGDPDA